MPLMIASVLAYMLTEDYKIYQRQLTRRQFGFDISTLEDIWVADMEGVNAFERMNSSCYPQAIRFMVVDPEDGEKLVGILSRIDVLEAMEALDEWHHR